MGRKLSAAHPVKPHTVSLPSSFLSSTLYLLVSQFFCQPLSIVSLRQHRSPLLFSRCRGCLYLIFYIQSYDSYLMWYTFVIAMEQLHQLLNFCWFKVHVVACCWALVGLNLTCCDQFWSCYLPYTDHPMCHLVMWELWVVIWCK